MVDSSDHGDAAEEMPKEENGHAGEPVDSAACPIESKTGPEEAQPLKPRSWKWQVVFLCFYGFMVQLKPGEAFITPLLLSVEKNFTREQVTNEIIPVLTYSYMAVLVPVFLLTDWLRYKPVLVLQSISYVSIWLILLLGTSLIEMQFMEFFYGITMAARVAYSSYIFSLVPASVYQRVASYSRSSVLLGVFTSSVMGQLCLARGLVTYSTLSIISLGFVSIGLLLSLCLPWPKRSLFFNLTPASASAANQSELERMRPDQAGKSLVPAARREPSWRDSVFVQMLLELRNVTRVPSLRLWSLWWVFNSAGYYLVVFNVPILWNTVYSVTENTKVHNGYVEAVATLFGAATSFTAGFVKIRWKVWSELVIGVITASQAALLLLMGTTENIWVCYTAYAFFRGFYQFLVPIAIFQIASSLTKELCALVFGVNTFLSTILKTIISIIVADKRGLTLAVHSQFFVYFFYFAFLTVIYLACAAWVITHHYRRQGRPTQEATPRELTPIEGYAVEVEPLSSSSAVKA